ncbi:hypothetical protein BDZ94DRAFT_1268842 [Collybia nuda]|uniref:Uncharacterized protein n=1 Tax=Collybia nuda TaxID=64659 RepID=A0A9P5XYQ5_9AGAR|nr:hypothetical protein BDZ94DRAFT_1268842 [Collybia nuda]
MQPFSSHVTRFSFSGIFPVFFSVIIFNIGRVGGVRRYNAENLLGVPPPYHTRAHNGRVSLSQHRLLFPYALRHFVSHV